MPKDFINKFNSKDSYIKVAVDKVSSENKKKIMRKVIENIPYSVYETEFLYDIRYNKKIPYGFEQIWQKANHIITTHKHYRTEEGNLNFVFSGLEDKVTQWSQLYLLLPGLLYYTAMVCTFLYYAAIDSDNEIDKDFLKRASIGYIISSKNNIGTVEEEINNVTLECQECSKKIKLNSKAINDLKTKFTINCDCGNEIYLFEID